MIDFALILISTGLLIAVCIVAYRVYVMEKRQEQLEILLVQAKFVVDRLEARLRTETEAGPCDFDG